MKLLNWKGYLWLLAPAVAFFVYFNISHSNIINDAVGFITRMILWQTSHDVYQDVTRNVKYYNESGNIYSLNLPWICFKEVPFLVVIVKSPPKHFDQRQAIRSSWGNISNWNVNRKVIVLFSLGIEIEEFNAVQDLVNLEHNLYSDIIQEVYIEHFHNLTRKLISQIKWISKFCYNANYFMTTDDDVFLHIRNLVAYLELHKNNNVYLGCVHSGSSPVRDDSSKYFVPRSIYPGLYYPDYCTGAGYVLSIPTVQMAYKFISSLPMLYIDDVYMGILLNKLGIFPQHSSRFFCEAKVPNSDNCLNDYFITSHGYTPEGLFSFYNQVSKISSNSVDFVCLCKLLLQGLKLIS